MSIHFSAKRPTRLKTADVTGYLNAITENFKNLEDLEEKFTEKARNIKKHLKELDKIFQDNDKKREKNKAKEKDYEKEHRLISEINSELKEIKSLNYKIIPEYIKVTKSSVLNGNKMADEWIRHAALLEE